MDKPYDNTNSGVLFKNDKREEDWQPEYTGSIDVGGVQYWISAKLRTSQKGTKFMSLKVKPKDVQTEYVRGSQDAISAQIRDELDDEIPF